MPDDDPTELASDWGYQLAQQFLDAAVSCGAVCANRRIVDWGEPPTECGAPGDCACVLRCSVLEGYTRIGTGRCDLERTAQIEVVLDVCRYQPPRDQGADVAAAQAVARDHSVLRWLIAKGIYSSWRQGRLCAGDCDDFRPGVNTSCETFTPGPWQYVADVGTCARYRMVWTYRATTT